MWERVWKSFPTNTLLGTKPFELGSFPVYLRPMCGGGSFGRRAVSLGKGVEGSFPSYNLLGKELVAWGSFPAYEAPTYEAPVWE